MEIFCVRRDEGALAGQKERVYFGEFGVLFDIEPI